MTSADRSGAPDWFRDPARAFRPAAFWFWHRIPSEAEIAGQLADMATKGLGTVMVQARLALPLESYLSEPYLAAFRFAAEEARRQGLAFTIYDEYNWMSGHGGGRTVAGADHLRERHLFWSTGTARGGRLRVSVSKIRSSFLDFLGETGRSWVYEGGAPRWGDWQLVAAIAHPDGPIADPERDIRPLSGPMTVIEADPTGCTVEIDLDGPTAPGETVTVFLAARCLTSRLINYLLPEAAQRYAEAVYAPLLEASGGTADGFFFDHPYAGFYVWDEHRGDLGNSLLWDESLLGDSKAASPADACRLLALLRDVGPATARLRAGFLASYGERLHEAFFGTLARWTGERGVGFTGHELLKHVGAWGLHDGLQGFDARTMPGVDYFGIDAYRTTTSVDAADYAPQLSAKLGDSVARAHGRRRCTIEQYSTGRETGTAGLAGQWGLTAASFRAQAIRHLLFGARRILLHAVNVTDGSDGDPRLLLNPRFDFPPGFNFEPWWEDCPGLFAELARLSAFLEEGDPLRPVALLYPLEAIRAEADPACAKHFGWWAEALARAGIGYDIVDEAMLETVVGGEPRYETLVLPAVTTLASAASARVIAAFVRGGGRMLASGPLPRAAGRDPDCGAALAEIRDHPAEGQWPFADKAVVDAVVAKLPRPRLDARFEGDDPSWTHVARVGETWRVATVNDQAWTRRLTIRCDAAPSGATVWNAATGDVSAVDPSPVDGGIAVDIDPGGLLLLSFPCDGAAPAEHAPRAEQAVPAGQALAGPIPPPIRLADGWALSIGDGAPLPVAVDAGWEGQGYPEFAGTGTYRRSIALPTLADGLAWHLVLPGLHETVTCRLDGQVIGHRLAGPATIALPVAGREVLVELAVRNTAANRYYAGTPFWDGIPQPSGLTQPPYLIATARDDSIATGVRVV